MTKIISKRRVLTVIMDGVGYRESTYGNAIALAHTPNMDFLNQSGLSTTLKAHGTYVGLPSNQDIGNSEVGHNALGSGRQFPQGASLIGQAFADESIYLSDVWKQLVDPCVQNSTLHFIGLLSDGNVHSHIDHLLHMLKRACQEGVKKIRIHTIFDGRDVEDQSAEVYAEKLERVLDELHKAGCDALVASGGGRMHITMDRYGADWKMVKRGWDTHVHGKAQLYPSLAIALSQLREQQNLSDQYLPEFCIGEKGKANGPIEDGDRVLLFNFRGDRAIEICQAFENDDFHAFDRGKQAKVYFAGMMQYDGDLNIPKNYLVSPPHIQYTLSEHLSHHGYQQFACSETQKYGHVTYFWNGNKSGKFDNKLEHYVEIPSENISFDQKPWMKAYEITEETCKRMLAGNFSFGRINYANGDMVGHTGHLAAAITAVSTVDLMLGKLIEAARKSDTILVVTADHGNCDEMFIDSEPKDDHCQKNLFPNRPTPKAKTSHTLAEVPFYVYDPLGSHKEWSIQRGCEYSLANVANTCLNLMGLNPFKDYKKSVLTRK